MKNTEIMRNCTISRDKLTLVTSAMIFSMVSARGGKSYVMGDAGKSVKLFVNILNL